MSLTDDQRRPLESRLQEERERAQSIIRRYDESEGANPTTSDGDTPGTRFTSPTRGPTASIRS